MTAIYVTQTLFGLITVICVFFFLLRKTYKHSNQICDITREAGDLLSVMRTHEHKLKIMLYTLERRHEQILSEEEKPAPKKEKKVAKPRKKK